MGGIVHKDRKGTFSFGKDSLNDDHYNKYDKETLAAVKNIKDGPTTNIELTISCSNLPKFDYLSQTDPRVYCLIEKDGRYEECGKTEVVQNDPNPKFKTKLKVPYNFEKNQIVKFEIYDVDEFREDESDKKEFIGDVIIPLHEIVCAHNQTLTKDIAESKHRKNKQSTITIRGNEYDESSSKVFFTLGARSFVSKNELSLHMSLVEGQDITFLKKCDHIQNTKKGFDWPTFSIPSNTFPDERSIVKFEVYERTKQKPRNLIGSAEVSFGSMMNSQIGRLIKITKEGFTVGELKLKECKKETEYTFLNYVYGGAEISLIIALDFTNSNKDPTNEKSLHYLSENSDNEYLQALKSIGEILQHYDSDKKIPLFGFGAKLPPQYNTVSHCFSMNKNYFDPEVNGLEEVLQVYRESLKSYKFHGPTIFSEILKMAVDYANYEKNEQLSQKYIILLIITDGDINDMQATKDQIVKAQDLPLSVLIVGVGDNEFSEMKVLDGDIGTGDIISSDGIKCERDIVQFVPFSKFKNNYEALARETLEEIPKQFLEYMKMKGIEPKINKNNGVIKTHDYLKGHESKKKEHKFENQIPSFLQHARNEFTDKLIKLEMNPELVEEILNEGIAAPDVGLFIELASEKKKNVPIPETIKEDLSQEIGDKVESKQDVSHEEPEKKVKMKTRQIVLNKERDIEAEKSKAKEESYKITQKLLEDRDREYLQRKIQALGIEYVQKNEATKSEPVTLKKRKVFAEYQDHNEHFKTLTRDTTPISVEDNVCLSCRENVINTVFMPCGHAALCQNCLVEKVTNACIICKQKTQYFMTTKT